MRVISHEVLLGEDKAGNRIFWEVCVLMGLAPVVRTRFGRVGTVGTIQEREFNATVSAMKAAHSQTLSMFNKGYTQISAGVLGIPPIWEVEVDNSRRKVSTEVQEQPRAALSPQRGKWDLL